MHILMIEDEKDIADTLRETLKPLYAIDVVYSGKQGLYKARVNHYDCIIVDLGLPDMDGVEICKALRAENVASAILVLTGRGEVDQKVLALDSGADDYLTKPFSSAELAARIRALLRRSNGSESLTTNTLTVGNLVLDITTRTVTRNNTEIDLRKKEFDLLEYLMRNQGRVLTRGMILEHVWNDDMDPFTNAIDVHVKYLRDAIDRPFGNKMIKTVHGLGYKIEA